MFDSETIAAVSRQALQRGLKPAAVLAVAQVESGGQAFDVVGGQKLPLIRFEGHYFWRRLKGDALHRAVALGLASPKAGGVRNPRLQAARYAMLGRAIEVDEEAALESCSWGVGQVMGSHWEALGFASVHELVHLAKRDVAGQIELMLRFIEWAGLRLPLLNRDWRTFARGYNGPAFAQNAYDTKMAAAFADWERKLGTAEPSRDRSVRHLQERLFVHGFPVATDGVAGPKTLTAVKSFQRSRGLAVDGIAGPKTWAALEAAPTIEQALSAELAGPMFSAASWPPDFVTASTAKEASMESALTTASSSSSFILPLVRHGLQVVAGYLVARGHLDPTNAETLVGGVVAIGTVAWWFFTKPKPAVAK